MIEIEIDGRQVEVAEGSTVMDAAGKLGIYIPHFCYHRKLSIAANCRMCLVQVEKAPKPLPACATPATPGMKVSTHSDYAIRAQKAVMEFLLINHPLDCPICDQGGECQLQDLAVGYGGGASRYHEEKRVVTNKNLGALISTDMTRCIHCTRCVRFGQEIADVMELGMAGRGEHSEIMPFVERTVDSELSGNVIDLCPVGALTSKPFRYSARTWELARRRSVSPHDGLGSNLIVQTQHNRVMRVLPAECEEINECWLADRDRYSYEALNSEERLTQPMIRSGGEWHPCEWKDALAFVADGLRRIRDRHGAEAIGALATPHQTLEELYLLQKLVRGLGSGNVDHRLRQPDSRGDGSMTGAPWLGRSIASVSGLRRFLVVGSTLRKDHPLLAARIRGAIKRGAEMSLINPVDDRLLVEAQHKLVVAPGRMAQALAGVLRAAAEATGIAVEGPARAAAVAATLTDGARAIARSLLGEGEKAVFLGNLAQHHPDWYALYALATELARVCGATVGVLGEAANSVGAWLAGAVPMHGAVGAQATAGLAACAMLEQPRRAYLLLGVEAELDSYDPQRALAAMGQAELVVALSAFRHRASEYAHVLLPIAPFTETAGSFVNTEGRLQSFAGVVRPLGDARPAWKVLRVLGNLLGLAGFDHDSAEAVRREIGIDDPARLRAGLAAGYAGPCEVPAAGEGLQRIGEVPIYQADALVRRAKSLQLTRDAEPPVASLSGAEFERLGLREGDNVLVRQGSGEVVLRALRDDRLPPGCVRVAAAHPMTAALGGMFAEIGVERAG